jgi:ribonuclease HIII
MPTFTKVKKEDLKHLDKHGFYKVEPKTKYEQVRLKSKNATMVLFTTNKLLIQGKPENIEPVLKFLREKKIGKEVKPITFKQQDGTYIGSDEALKGDSFGGIVVAGVKANNKQRQQLLELGVGDSKNFTDEDIRALAPEIEKMTNCIIENIYPDEYNSFEGNVTKMLDKLHKACYDGLKPGKHVVDKYPGCKVGDIIETKAESKYVEVAAASILARAHALKQLDDISKRAGFTVPKGSTHVEDALKKIKKKDAQNLVKLHFNNVRKVLEK